MKRNIVLGVTLTILTIVLVGCGGSRSQHILTSEYLNPTTNKVERIEIPVSKNTYENSNVGDSLPLTIHTLLLGIRVAIMPSTPISSIALADTMPAALWLIAFYPFGVFLVSLIGKRKPKYDLLILSLIGVLIIGLLMSTLQPDFITISTIIDKDFIIR